VMPEDDALVLMLLRYPQELVDPNDYKLPAGATSSYRIADKEFEMASQLIDSMSAEWAPDAYHDEFRERLSDIIKKRIKSKGATAKVSEDAPHREDAATNVVDFVALLQKSLGENRRTPAKAASKTPAKKTAKSTTKKAAKKAPPKKRTTKTAKKAVRKA